MLHEMKMKLELFNNLRFFYPLGFHNNPLGIGYYYNCDPDKLEPLETLYIIEELASPVDLSLHPLILWFVVCYYNVTI